MLQYTGGTTGLPKGAMLTHGNLTAACAQFFASQQGATPALDEGVERLLVVLPLFHIYSLTVNLLYGVKLGALQVLHSRFDLDAVVDALIAKRISLFLGVPTMYTALANDGCVFIVDRTKDTLLCVGYNVYPRLIEEAIYEHPSVEEVGVIGIPDPYRASRPGPS